MTMVDVMSSSKLNKSDSSNHACFLHVSQKEAKETIVSSLNSTIKQDEIVHKQQYSLNEVDSLRQFRIRTLSNWPHFKPNAESMALAGWFCCNLVDRVICIYCNTICHEWTKDDDPIAVHAILAPHCPFVHSLSVIKTAPKIVNNTLDNRFQPSHPNMAGISRRQETFSNPTWKDTSPSIEDFVRAGFFSTGISNTVTCFYCNGSLHQWGTNDSPMIEHVRWFPDCTYARHLCGEELYGKVLISNKRMLTENKIDENELKRSVAARLDLPVVQRLRSQYSLGIIKRCLEDQLKNKNDDFVSDLDFTMACLILQKQIDIIKGCKDRIITPSKHPQLETSMKSSKQSLGECLICLTEEKKLACLPCGHLCACVSCGYALRSCPVCREKIQCFLRINS
ncbi:hypothetical protein I4U23_001357 [Adineta vaga]|nr:hypothetical protein I4U23_001357 [Adineta vaga]